MVGSRRGGHTCTCTDTHILARRQLISLIPQQLNWNLGHLHTYANQRDDISRLRKPTAHLHPHHQRLITAKRTKPVSWWGSRSSPHPQRTKQILIISDWLCLLSFVLDLYYVDLFPHWNEVGSRKSDNGGVHDRRCSDKQMLLAELWCYTNPNMFAMNLSPVFQFA